MIVDGRDDVGDSARARPAGRSEPHDVIENLDSIMSGNWLRVISRALP
jgi:hypothetical protein